MNKKKNEVKNEVSISIHQLEVITTEIKYLRRENKELKGKLHMFDKMILLFESQPSYSYKPMAPDYLHNLEHALKEAKK